MLSKKVKIKLDYNQELIINTLSNEHRLLYNHLLDFTKNNKLDFKLLNNCYKNYRNDRNLTINSKSSQNTCIGFINNIKSFYALHKKDITAKFPYKFKSYKYFTSFTYDNNNGQGGFKLIDNTLIINLLSSSNIAKKLIIKLPKYCNDMNMNNIKQFTIKKENDEYYIIFVYSEKENDKILNKDNYISIDLGYTNLVNGVTKEENIKIENYRQKKLDNKIKDLQSKKDKKVKYSNNYKKLNKKLNKYKKKHTNKLKDYQHKVSKKIIDYCINNDIGSIIIGDLKVKKVINKDNKVINGESKLTSIGRFKTYLEYKAKNAKIDYKLINEFNTSKTNCLSGLLEFNSSLKNREFIYNNIKIDRDFNSCINILTKSGKWLSQDDKIHLLNNKINYFYYSN